MSSMRFPGADGPPSSLYVVLNPFATPEQRGRTLEWIAAALPTLCWRAHLYLLSEASAQVLDGMQEICAVVAAHLQRYQLISLTLHPLVTVADLSPLVTGGWQRLLEPALGFQDEAYREQGEARLVISPILVPTATTDRRHMEAAAAFFRDRLAPPIVVGWGEAPVTTHDLGDRMRVLVGPAGGSGVAATLRELAAHHVFDTVLDRIDAGGGDLIAHCARHVVLDEGAGQLSPCLQAWLAGLQPSALAPPPAWPARVTLETCRQCTCASLPRIRASLEASGRRSEGRKAALAAAMELARGGEAAAAVDLAAEAGELSDGDEERAAALLHQGLCLLDCARLQEAEKALEAAQACSPDPALVAYHRGRVQVAWRDDIVALEHYAVALQLGSEAISAAELHLEMALSHVRLEEYPEARQHLELAEAPGHEVGIAFNRGICDLNEGLAEAALGHFRAALSCGPADDDLGRVLLYIATSLKELERYDDAIDTLREAVAAEPEELAIHNLLGYCYYRLKRHEEAVQSFRRALEIDPRSAIDWANLGSNLRDLGRNEQAITMYRRALELDPTIGFAAASLQGLTAPNHESG